MTGSVGKCEGLFLLGLSKVYVLGPLAVGVVAESKSQALIRIRDLGGHAADALKLHVRSGSLGKKVLTLENNAHGLVGSRKASDYAAVLKRDGRLGVGSAFVVMN